MMRAYEVTSSAEHVASPFLSDPARPVAGSPAALLPQPRSVSSPFTSAYMLEGEHIPAPEAEAFASVLGELYSEEFEDAVAELVAEASAFADQQFTADSAISPQSEARTEQALREFLAPLERESGALLDRMSEGAAATDLAALSEGELDEFLDRYEPTSELPSPVFENFLKSLWNKAKSAVSTVAKVAGRFLPLNIILGKLKALVRPLLDRVLKFAIDKLPVALRPIAQQLAKRFLREAGDDESSDTIEATAALREFQEATPDIGSIQQELDTRLGGFIVHGEAFERELEALEFSQAQTGAEQAEELQEARAELARALGELPPGGDPTPAIERFLPVVLSVARLAIGAIGRKRVVDALAKLVAGLISRYIGKDQAVALSRSLVDAGLRMMSLEASPETEQQVSRYTLASTVEDTINHLVAQAPPEAFEDSELLEAYAWEAFETAAAVNFPDATIRPDLREAAHKPGAWILMPLKGPRKRYKKYTHVADVSITPQMAESIKGFGGVTLASMLQDQLGVSAPVAARIHLYEAIRGTTLPRIAAHERGVAGLGPTARGAWSLLQPLSVEAAGLLLQEPKLGVAAPASFVQGGRRLAVGQRFYYLEIPGARLRRVHGGRRALARQPLAPAPVLRAEAPRVIAKSSSSALTLDFPRGQLRLKVYYSEAEAQQLAALLKGGSAASGALAALVKGRGAQLRDLLSTTSRRLKIIHEAVPTEQFAAPVWSQLLTLAGPKLAKVVSSWLVAGLRAALGDTASSFVAQFEQAAQADADGVTLILTFHAPPFFDPLRKALSGNWKAVPALLAALGSRNLPRHDVRVRAGRAQR